MRIIECGSAESLTDSVGGGRAQVKNEALGLLGNKSDVNQGQHFPYIKRTEASVDPSSSSPSLSLCLPPTVPYQHSTFFMLALACEYNYEPSESQMKLCKAGDSALKGICIVVGVQCNGEQ